MGHVLLFAPGAGLPSGSPWMQAWIERLAPLGTVLAFDHPYQQAGRKRPDRMPILVDHARTYLQQARNAHPEASITFVGKSMGSRVGCHLSLMEPIDRIICFGYPLAGGKHRDKLRDQVLMELQTPILFIQGTRDKLAPLETLATVRARMEAPSELHVVPTGDHSLQITKTHTKQTGRSQENEDEQILLVIHNFLGAVPESSPSVSRTSKR